MSLKLPGNSKRKKTKRYDRPEAIERSERSRDEDGMQNQDQYEISTDRSKEQAGPPHADAASKFARLGRIAASQAEEVKDPRNSRSVVVGGEVKPERGKRNKQHASVQWARASQNADARTVAPGGQVNQSHEQLLKAERNAPNNDLIYRGDEHIENKRVKLDY